MDKDTLSQKIIEHYTCEEYELLAETVNTALGSLRGRTIDALSDLLARVEGKLRMALLEVLIKDGGADLIPLFIDCIRSEKNALYAKSQILLFKEFRHQRALGALLSIENEIDTELKATFQRTLGRLLSQFSEQFYMSEFQAGIGDPRRVAFAADMMLRSPHPEFLPFLSERIQENDLGYREQGLRVLREQGDKTANNAIFAMFSRLRRQIRKGRAFSEALDVPRTDLATFFGRLTEGANLNWDPSETQLYLKAIENGDVEDVLEQILDGYRISGEVRKKVKPYLKGLLCGGEPSGFQTSRSKSALDAYLGELDKTQHTAAAAMGVIADRTGEKDFLERLEHYLPGDDPERDPLIISSLSGFRNDSSRDLLVDYVNTCTETEILEHALSALEEYQLNEVPKGVEKLCFDETNGVLRRRAVNLMARWGKGPEIAASLLAAESLAVRADGVRVVAEYNLSEGYGLLLDMLKKEIPNSLLISVLEGLAAFPRAQTGLAVKGFLVPPHAPSVRKAALMTCFRAGGNERMETIARALIKAPPGQNTEQIDLFLNLLLSEDFEDREAFLMGERDFWMHLLTREDQSLWPKVLQLLENLPLGDGIIARGWLMSLKKVAASLTGEPDSNGRRILALVKNLTDAVRRLNNHERDSKMLHVMLEALNTPNSYQRTQAMRNLVLNYPTQAIARNEAAVKKILRVCMEEFERKDTAKDTLVQACSLAGKVRHPKLTHKLKAMLEYPNIDVRAAAKRALDTGLDSLFTHPVRTVFVMDDSRYITKQLTKVLTRQGYETDFENDVEAGLTGLEKQPFDVLILDVIMPRKTGAEFLREARRRRIAPEFTLVITSSRSKQELGPIMSMGVDGLLLKPFRMEEMLNRISEFIPTRGK